MGKVKHGLSGTRTYKAWAAMIYRCTKSDHPNFADYGARGISVCERWMVFERFVEDMGLCPDGLELDRSSVNGNYEPGNCKWVTHAEQSINKRKSLYVEIDGASIHLKSEARRLGVSERTVYSRYKHGVRGTALFAKPVINRCPHDRSGDNVYIEPNGRRHCRACSARRHQERMTA